MARAQHLQVLDGELPPLDETPYRVETVEGLLAQPDPVWLIDGILQQGTLALVFGPPGCGKSLLVQDFAFHLALGQPWFGHSYDAAFGLGVLYVAAEAGGGTAARVKAFCRHHDLADGVLAPEACPVHFVRAPVNLLDPETVAAVELTWAAWANRFEVIIFDTLSRCMPGGNENSSEHMTAAIYTLDRIRERTGATIIVVHHTPLAEKGRPRGHSSLLAAADTAIMVEKLGEVRRATVTYHRDGREGARLIFRLSSIETGRDAHGRPVTSCVVEPADLVVAKAARPLTDNQRDAYEVLVESVKRAGGLPPDAEAAGHSGTVPQMSRRIPVKIWREEFHRRVSEGRDINRDSSRKAFNRAGKALHKIGKVGFCDGHAWVIWSAGT